MSTPVIDPTEPTVHIVTWPDGGSEPQDYKYRLHALRLKDGVHVTSPVILEAPGLNARHQKQRPGLLLTGGVLYIVFGGDSTVLKDRLPPVLRKLVSFINCEQTPRITANKQLNPYADFVDGPPRTIYRNWESVTSNYALGGKAAQLDRGGRVLR